MMAGRRLKEALCPDPPKRSAYSSNHVTSEPRKPIPGWTDGSNAWRSAVYSFSAPTNLANTDSTQRENSDRAYRSCIASPHRSRGVSSTLSDTSRTSAACHPGYAASLPRLGSETEELYSHYSKSLSRRSESRASLFPSTSPTDPQSLGVPRRRERSLLKPGAEGKLLVPDVKLRAHSGSSSSLSSVWGASSYPDTYRRNAKSPLAPGSHQDFRSGRSTASSVTAPKKLAIESEFPLSNYMCSC